MRDLEGNDGRRGESAGSDDANSLSSPPEPVPGPPPVPPDALKPWYYQGWFIVPTFVWWPSSAVLFIRSPWHNGVVSGALSWAWIIVGGGWIFLRTQLHWRSGESLIDPTIIALVAPGIFLTILTQSLWLLKDRPRIRRIRDAGGFDAYESEEPVTATPAQNRTPAETPRSSSNRGGARRRRRRR